MSKNYFVYPTFSSGEITPSLHLNTKLPERGNALSKLSNFTLTEQGTAEKRNGYKFIANMGNYTNAFLIDYNSNGVEFVVVIIPNADCYVVDTNGTKTNIGNIGWLGSNSIYYAVDPTSKDLFIACIDFQLRRFKSDKTISIVSYTGNAPPSNPGSVCFYQGRMWLSSFTADRTKIMGSNSEAITSFNNVSSPPVDSDALILNIQVQGDIKWIEGGKLLFVGTNYSEYTIEASSNTVTNSDAELILQSSFGSAPVQPLFFNRGFTFASPDKTYLYLSNYARASLAWLPKDIGYLGKHLITGIEEVRSSRYPNNRIFIKNIDGSVSAITIQMDRDILGWQTLITDGDYKSIAFTKKDATVKEWAAIYRNGQLNIEYITYSESVYMDSYVHSNTGVSVSSVSGLSHLEGKTVQVVVDGAQQNDKVVTGGIISLDSSGTDIYVGLPYNSILETLPFDGTESQNLSSMKKHNNKIYVRVIGSVPPNINGQDPRARTPATPMGTTEPIISGDIKVADNKYDDFGKILIEHNLPYACNILGVFTETNVSAL